MPSQATATVLEADREFLRSFAELCLAVADSPADRVSAEAAASQAYAIEDVLLELVSRSIEPPEGLTHEEAPHH